MPKALIVASGELRTRLGETVLWRSGVERIFAPDIESIFDLAHGVHPNLILLDGRNPGALDMLRRLREDGTTRSLSILVALPRYPPETEIWQRAGANGVLTEAMSLALWDERIEDLLNVPRRQNVRLRLHLRVGMRADVMSKEIAAVALNISLHGLLVETPEPLVAGTMLQISLMLPGGAASLRLVGRTVWTALPAEGVSRSGIEFLAFQGNAMEEITQYLESGTGGPS